MLSRFAQAEGIAVRLRWSAVGQDLLVNLFLLFLLLVGFTRFELDRNAAGKCSPCECTSTTRHVARGVVARCGDRVGCGAGRGCADGDARRAASTILRGGAGLGSRSGLGDLAALAALASEVAFRGFLFQRLIDATGPATATILLSLIYALIGSLGPNGTGLSFVVTFVAGVLFSMAYLRTHALWLGWGMHFAWAAATAVVFGLPIAGEASYSSIVQTDTSGPVALTGGVYGPDGALFTLIVLVVAMAVVYRATRNYAWSYTHPELVPGGYPMDVPPPPAHAAMEQRPRR